MYFKRVVKRRSACMTDDEVYALQAAAREHALELAKTTSPDRPPATIGNVLCWWCRTMHSPGEVQSCMALPEKRAIAAVSGSSTSNALVAGLLTPFSELWAVLTAQAYPDGRKRLTGRLSLSCESSLLKVTVTDPETGLYGCLTGSSVDDLLLAIETGLADGTFPWRASSYDNGKARKK
jgi:hypothetical protein